MFRLYASKHPIEPAIDFEKLAGMTEGYSGADIKGVVDKAVQIAIREYLEKAGMNGAEAKLRWEHLIEALRYVRPTQGKQVDMIRATTQGQQQRFGVN